MLTRITVQGFKSLRDVQIELGQINVFVGANGSGKTNLLEAIGLLGSAVSGYVDDQALLRRGVRPGTSVVFISSFKDKESLKSISIHALWRTERVSAKYRAKFVSLADVREQSWLYEDTIEFNDDGEEWPLITDFDHHGPEGAKIVVENLRAVLNDYAVFAPITPALRGAASDATQRQPIGLTGERLPEAVNQLLDVERGIFGDLELDELFELLDWVDEIAVVPPSREIVSPSVPTTRNIIRFTDRWMADSNNQLSAHDASEGALYVLFALVLALHPKSSRLFAIDNFDQAMHPRLARATMRLFCQQILKTSPERQVMLTTHNPLVLDGLDLRDDRIRLFAVERSSQGATQVHRVQVSDEVLQATQEGLSLSNLWVMGRLGGVPDLF